MVSANHASSNSAQNNVPNPKKQCSCRLSGSSENRAFEGCRPTYRIKVNLHCDSMSRLNCFLERRIGGESTAVRRGKEKTCTAERGNKTITLTAGIATMNCNSGAADVNIVYNSITLRNSSTELM